MCSLHSLTPTHTHTHTHTHTLARARARTHTAFGNAKDPLKTVTLIVGEIVALAELGNEKHDNAEKENEDRIAVAELRAAEQGKQLVRKPKAKSICAKDLISDEYPTLTKHTFACYYKCAFSGILSTFTQLCTEAQVTVADVGDADMEAVTAIFDRLRKCDNQFKEIVQCSGAKVGHRTHACHPHSRPLALGGAHLLSLARITMMTRRQLLATPNIRCSCKSSTTVTAAITTTC
jgi:hypothetical protein